MSVLLDSLAAGFDGDDARRELLDAALRDGLPGARTEAWKYTSLRALERRNFAVAAAQPLATLDDSLLADIPSPRLVFANGAFDAAASDLAGLPAGVELAPLSTVTAAVLDGEGLAQPRFAHAEDVFARLCVALGREGVVLRVDQGVEVRAPLHLVFVGMPAAGDVAWHARYLLELRRGTSATVVEHHLAPGVHAHLANALCQVRVAESAALVHVRVQGGAPGATSFLRTDASLARDAHYQRIDLELGSGLSRHELNVRLDGERASLAASGVLFADGRRHLDTRLSIEHAARDTRCQLLWRGLAAGRARAAFHGGILIHTGADGSDANLSNKNLLLSEQAEIDSQPVLEIHADEVKAAHGATVGQLDPLALFYLRSRGLPEPEARRLLTAAFCREVVAGFDAPALRATLESSLDAALARLVQA